MKGRTYAQIMRSFIAVSRQAIPLEVRTKGVKNDSYLQLSQVCVDGGTQSRAVLSQLVIEDYKEAVLEGAVFPPVDVFFDGETYWLADGFHRYFARSAAGKLTIEAVIHEGGLRDAILFSLGANAEHGLRRSRADKQRAVLTLLRDPEWWKWSDRVIASKANVSQVCVSSWRKNTAALSSFSPTRIGCDGRVFDPTKMGNQSGRTRGALGTRRIMDSLEMIDESLDPFPQYRPVQSLIRQAMNRLVDLMQEHKRKRVA